MDLKQHRVNAIEQKIGRNLLLLQKIEYLLKYIVKHHDISAPIGQLNQIAKQKEDNLKTQTMGTVLSLYLNQINTISDKNIDTIESGKLEQELYYLMLANDFPLVIELAKISIQKHRLDGWTSLSLAGNVIRKTLPNEVFQLKEKYNHKTLKSLLLSEKIFDIKEDVSQSMILFRLKSDWREYFEQYWKDYYK